MAELQYIRAAEPAVFLSGPEIQDEQIGTPPGESFPAATSNPKLVSAKKVDPGEKVRGPAESRAEKIPELTQALPDGISNTSSSISPSHPNNHGNSTPAPAPPPPPVGNNDGQSSFSPLDATEKVTVAMATAKDAHTKEEDICEEHAQFLKSAKMQQKRCKITKNLVVLCLTFVLTFTAFGSVQSLQSSVNRIPGLRTVSLGVFYATLIPTCLFLSPLVSRRLGYKWTITLALVPFALYMAANFYATWATLIPASALVGVGAALLWPAKCSYLTVAGEFYSGYSGETSDIVITRFFGIFFMARQSGYIWDNLISAFVLKTVPDQSLQNINASHMLEACGALYCRIHSTDDNNSSFYTPHSVKVYTLCGTYLFLCVLAILTTALCLDKLPETKSTTDHGVDRDKVALCDTALDNTLGGSSIVDGGPVSRGWRGHRAVWRVSQQGEPPEAGKCNYALATVCHCRNKYQLLIIPMTVYSGLQQAFLWVDFTESYVSCSLGVWMVGPVLICYGVMSAIFSCIFGLLVKHGGRLPYFVLAGVINLGVLLGLFMWQPDPAQLHVFFITAAFWGIANGIWQTHLNALYGCIFRANREAVFASYRVWESVGFALAFALSHALCMYVKIYGMLGTLALAMGGYFTLEILLRRNNNNNARTNG